MKTPAPHTQDLPERAETIRNRIVSLLEEYTMTSRDLSRLMRVTERDVCDHLEHIRRSLNKDNRKLEIVPAACDHCGFVFTKRGRISRPGKCPICHSSQVHPPLFHVLNLAP